MRRSVALLAVVVAVAVAALPVEGRPLPGAAQCSIFPRTSHWNLRADRLPVHPRSDEIVAAVGRSAPAHADFGSGLYEGRPIGIPYRVVGAASAASVCASGTPRSPTAGATRYPAMCRLREGGDRMETVT